MPSSTGLYSQGVHIIFNISGSHYQPGKQKRREDLIVSTTQKNGGVYLYSNFCGCDGTRLYFDGASMISINGVLVNRAEQFVIKDVDVLAAVVNLADIDKFRTPYNGDLGNNPFYCYKFEKVLIPGFKIIVKGVKPTLPLKDYEPCIEKELSFGPAC